MGRWLHKPLQGSAAALPREVPLPGAAAESRLSWSSRSHLLLYQRCCFLVEMSASPLWWRGCRLIVILDLEGLTGQRI